MQKPLLIKLSLVSLLLLGLVVGCNKNENLSLDAVGIPDSELVSFGDSQFIDGQYIVILKKAANDRSWSETPYEIKNREIRAIAESMLAEAGITDATIGHCFGTALRGFVVSNISEQAVAKLQGDNRVDYIEQDQTISVQGGPPGGGGGGGGGGGEPAQTTPWGIARVGGGVSGANKTAWVIDTGIDLDHPDLNVDQGNSVSFLTGGGGNTSPDDYNGHGTHVAGTIAAIDNNIGVIGVAEGATVVAVRVLDRRGSGTTSGVIAGVDYVAANASGQDVANMSLGGGVSTSLDNAVINASGTCKFALAAGNESDHANNHSPARANGNNIYTVSAMANGDVWAYYSNYGNPPVDYCAPGSSIHSCWKDGGYNTISGTSMATPHVAGLLLLGNISTDGNVSGDPDGNADPIAHN
jgi:hypothetical protein